MLLMLIGITIGVVVTHVGHLVSLASARIYTKHVVDTLLAKSK